MPNRLRISKKSCNFAAAKVCTQKILQLSMRMKTLKGICVIAMTLAVLCGCERQEPKDAREAFVGDYTYTYLAPDSIPVYIGSLKVGSIPVEGEGEFSLVLGNAENEL